MNAEANTVESESRELAATATDQALLTAITKAEIDQAIIAAHARPRSVSVFRKECRDLVCLDEETADECIYALPRREKNDKGQWETKFIEGPSARMGEIVAYSWRNNRSGARVTDEGRDFITAQGVYQDLERNVYITYEVRRRITNREGRRFNADMIQVTGNAACSIALRNAVFKGVPKAFWAPIYEEAQRVCNGDARTLVSRRTEALQALQKLNVTHEMVCAALGLAGVQDITVDHIATLRGLHNAVRDGEMTIENAFAPKADESEGPSTPQPSRAEQAKAALKEKGADKGKSMPPKQEHIPQHDAKSAIAAVHATKTLKDLEAAYLSIVEDFVDTNRAVPVEVEAAYGDHKVALEQQADK